MIKILTVARIFIFTLAFKIRWVTKLAFVIDFMQLAARSMIVGPQFFETYFIESALTLVATYYYFVTSMVLNLVPIFLCYFFHLREQANIMTLIAFALYQILSLLLVVAFYSNLALYLVELELKASSSYDLLD